MLFRIRATIAAMGSMIPPHESSLPTQANSSGMQVRQRMYWYYHHCIFVTPKFTGPWEIECMCNLLLWFIIIIIHCNLIMDSVQPTHVLNYYYHYSPAINTVGWANVGITCCGPQSRYSWHIHNISITVRVLLPFLAVYISSVHAHFFPPNLLPNLLRPRVE